MKWFKHDTDANSDVKLKKVRMKYGADGYAIYWYCLECIAGGVDKDNLTFKLEEDSETIAYEFKIQEHRVVEIMKYMVDLGLFEDCMGVITCLKLAKRMDKSMTNSPKMRKWLELQNGKNVMTLSDNVMTSAELEVELEKELELEGKDLSDSEESNQPMSPKVNQKKKVTIPYKEIQDLYNRILVFTNDPLCMTEAQVLSDKRKTAIRKYWGKEGKLGIEQVETYFNYLWENRNNHSWLFGNGNRNWKADLEFVMRDETIVKAREGRLGNWSKD